MKKLYDGLFWGVGSGLALGAIHWMLHSMGWSYENVGIVITLVAMVDVTWARLQK